MHVDIKFLVIFISFQLIGLSFQTPTTRGPTTRPTTRGSTTRPTQSPSTTTSTVTATTTKATSTAKSTTTTTTQKTTTFTHETTSIDQEVTEIFENVTDSNVKISQFRRAFTKQEIIFTVVMISVIAVILTVLTVILILARQKRAKDFSDKDEKPKEPVDNEVPSIYNEPADAIMNERNSGIYAEIFEFSTDIPTAQRILNTKDNSSKTSSADDQKKAATTSDTNHVPIYSTVMDDLTPNLKTESKDTEQKEDNKDQKSEYNDKDIYAVPIKKANRISQTTELCENEAYHSFKART